MKTLKLSFLIIATMVMSGLILIVSFFWIRSDNRKILNYEFNGKVDSVWYDDNFASHDNVTKPFVRISGKTFYLFYHSWAFGYKIQHGDSLVKQKNTLNIILIKKNGERLEFKGD